MRDVDEDVPFPVVAYFLADSSPQGSVNWMNHELIFIKGIDVLLVAKALRSLVHLCRPLDDDTDVEMDREAYEALERGYMETICEKVVHHYGVPAGLGSAPNATCYTSCMRFTIHTLWKQVQPISCKL